MNIQIVDLPGDELAEAIGNTILLDVDAAGFGWFIDPTPADDVEFQTGAPEVQGRVDLLTVITHEFGHVLGLTRDNDHASFMSDQLPLGTRYRIEEEDHSALDSIFANPSLSELLL